MRNLIIGFLTAALLAVSIALGLTIHNRNPLAPVTVTAAQQDAYKKGIAEIFYMRQTAVDAFLQGDPPHSLPRFVKYCANLHTERCPTDFRQAWIDYVSALERRMSQPSGLVPLVEIVGGIATAHVGGIKIAASGAAEMMSEGQKMKESRTDVTVALNQCVKIALGYGVEFPHQ